MKYFKYLCYIIRHKWFVLLECFKRGLLWRGITHDFSKLLPSEFLPYADFFYGEGRNIRCGRDKTGYYNPDTGTKEFDFAWFLHQKRNDHHWQYWIMPKDGSGIKILPMSESARIEMLCDWKGAGRAQGTPDTLEWYKKNGDKIQMNMKTKIWIEKEIGFDFVKELQRG